MYLFSISNIDFTEKSEAMITQPYAESIFMVIV